MPPKRAKARGLFSEFYGNAQNKKQLLKLHMRLNLTLQKNFVKSINKEQSFH